MKVGDKLKDNDPRAIGRILKIIGITDTHVEARSGMFHPVKIRKDRIYPEGKVRKSGFTLIETPEVME